MADASSPLICFSLTAHEAADVLADQVDNVLTMCPGSRVVLHLNQAFDASLPACPAAGQQMRRLLTNPDVILNPERLATRWAHMFHAHISNIALLRRLGFAYDYLMLLSSGDLIVRPGLAERLARHDAGVDAEALDGWVFAGRALEDARCRELAERAGVERIVHSYHEGSYYRRAVIEQMARRIDAVIDDWDYDASYPKEEVFFPTLVQAVDGLDRGRRLSHVLGYDPPTDMAAVRRVLRRIGLCTPRVSPTLAAWSASGPGAGDDDADDPYLLSRLPRRRDNLLRLLLADLSVEGSSPAARYLAGRLDPADTIDLDLPGATNTGHRRFDFLAGTLLPQPARSLLHVDAYADDHVMQVTLPPCPGGYGPAPRIDFRAGATTHWQAFCGHVPEGETTITVTKHQDRLRIACHNPALDAAEGVPTQGWGSFTLATAVSALSRRGVAALLRFRAPTMPDDAPRFWAELQRPGYKSGLWPRAHVHRRAADGIVSYWAIFATEMVETLRDETESGEVLGFITLPVTCGTVELFSYGVVEQAP